MENSLISWSHQVLSQIGESNVLLISGGTGSGKTSLAIKLSEVRACHVMTLDDYFLDECDLDFAIQDEGVRQWETPDCYDWNLVKSNISGLLNGLPTDTPIRSRISHKRVGFNKGIEIEENDLLIIEGLYGFHDQVISLLNDMEVSYFKVYINIDSEIRWHRKYIRDVLDRGESPDNLRSYFDRVVLPAETKFLFGQIDQSDIVVS